MAIYLSWIDYTLFLGLLLMSVAIGIYYGFVRKQSSVKEYFLGGKTMNVWPTSLSIVSSCLSGITLLTLPTEVYLFGITTALITFEISLIMGVTYFIYLPVFYKLQVTSIYEYLQLRFGKEMRIFASILYTIYMILFLPVVVYVPSLAIAEVTGASTEILTPVLCGICILYTTLGGLRAVVWTDALQFIFMIGTMLVVMLVGIIHAGGIQNVWRTANENGRLHMNFNLDLTVQGTFWSGAVGFLFIWLHIISLSQGTIQKCMSLSNYKDIKKSMIYSIVTFTLLFSFIYFTGLTMYSKYHNCDPLTSKKISKVDQLLPFFVMDVSKNLPGLAGLFIAGIVSASLSTLSAGINSLAATISEDFLKLFLNKRIPEQNVGHLLKLLVVLIGIICVAFVYVIEKLGSLLHLAITLISVVGGPMVGIFTVGMMVPMVNSIGAIAGGISSMCFLSWIAIGAHFYRREHPYLPLPLSTTGCAENITFAIFNGTESIVSGADDFILYKISQNYYALMALLLVVILSIVISFITKNTNKTVHPDCITPLMQFLLPKPEICLSSEEAIKLTDEGRFKK